MAQRDLYQRLIRDHPDVADYRYRLSGVFRKTPSLTQSPLPCRVYRFGLRMDQASASPSQPGAAGRHELADGVGARRRRSWLDDLRSCIPGSAPTRAHLRHEGRFLEVRLRWFRPP